MKKHHHSKRKQPKQPARARRRGSAVSLKTRHRSTRNQPKKKTRSRPRRPARPREVYVAIRKLLDTTNHIRARAAELETALEALREQERSKAVKELLLALRNSPDGDLLRINPAALGDAGNSTAQAIISALVEAFSILPIRTIGERIAVRDGQIPDTLELDRSIGEEVGTCVEAEVVSVGWRYSNQTLLKPVVRPIFAATPPSGAPEGKESE
jgi:hypothetical protein